MAKSLRNSLERERAQADAELFASISHQGNGGGGPYKSGRPQLYKAGTKFGELTILERYGNRATLSCSCGNVVEVSMTALTAGGKRDCGHVAAEAMLDRQENKPVGNQLYWIWRNMKNRCEDPNNPGYKDYGGRGITIWPAWSDDTTGFTTFQSDMGQRPSPEYTLDRMDSNGNYEPSNVRWATMQEQALNKRPRKRANNGDL